MAKVQERVARAKQANANLKAGLANFKASLALPLLPLLCTSRCASAHAIPCIRGGCRHAQGTVYLPFAGGELASRTTELVRVG